MLANGEGDARGDAVYNAAWKVLSEMKIATLTVVVQPDHEDSVQSLSAVPRHLLFARTVIIVERHGRVRDTVLKRPISGLDKVK